LKFEPWTFAFTLLGERVQRLLPYFQDLHSDMRKGGVKITFPAYISFMMLMSSIAFIFTMISMPFLLQIIFHNNFLSIGNILLSMMFATLSFILTFILIYIYPGIKSHNRAIPMEINLPYISNFLALLSSSNVSPRTIFRSVASIDTLREVRQEFSNIVRDVEVFGQDLLTSILENAKYMPSKRLREILTGYVATIRTGGDSTEYLRISTDNIMKEKLVKLDVMLESIYALAEIYIIVLVAMPLLFVVMFATFGMLGGGGGALNLGLMLYLLAYVGIPLMAAVLILVISTFAVR